MDNLDNQHVKGPVEQFEDFGQESDDEVDDYDSFPPYDEEFLMEDHTSLTNDNNVVEEEGTSTNDLEDIEKIDAQGSLQDDHGNDDSNIGNSLPVEAPIKDMTFETLEELENHLKSYAKQSGFAVSVRTVKPSRSTQLPPKHIIWICNKGRQASRTSDNKMKPRPSQKVDCRVRFNAKELDGLWKYSLCHLDHNHPLDPSDSRFLRAYRKVPKNAEERIVTNDKAGIRPAKSYLSEVVRSGGFQNVPFLDRDVRNLLQKKRQQMLIGPDSAAMYRYFMRCMRDSDNFYFMMDTDSDGRLCNVMWVDARSRAAYADFHDVVGFDTTYLKNKYDMPFAPFIGVNHHGQSILLGCALLSREDVDSFRWLFRTWLDCMGGVAPGGIVTDQSIPITTAIELEMPNTEHRWCLWHIMEKQNKKLRGYKDFKEIKKAMSAAVYDTMTTKDFETAWTSFVDQYGLKGNAWLNTLYEKRKRWVPTIVNKFFWAGMSTTQRNEGVNGYFKGYVNKKTALRQFVLQYDLALAAKCEKERQCDHSSRHTRYEISTKFAVERTFQPIYTHGIFQKIMNEVRGCMYTTLTIVNDEEEYYKYMVEDFREFGDLPLEKKVEYDVRLEKVTNHVSCSCKLFEMRGIMCRHSIKVYYHAGVHRIPEKYILTRWRKDVDRPYMRVKVPYYDPSKSENVVRYEKMQECFDRVATRAMNSTQECDIVMQGIQIITHDLDKCNTNAKGKNMSSQPHSQNEESEDVIFTIKRSDGNQSLVTLKDPKEVKAPGRPTIRVRGKKHSKKTIRLSETTGKGEFDDKEVKGPKQDRKQRKRKTRSKVTTNDEMEPLTANLEKHDKVHESGNLDEVGTSKQHDPPTNLHETVGKHQKEIPSNNNEETNANYWIRQPQTNEYTHMMEMFEEQFSQKEK